LAVRATRTGVRLDLGGIGKGYAVDCMADVLDDWGLDRVLVHGGFSSVLALDPPVDRNAWPLTLSDPAAPSNVLANLAIRQTALSASGLRKGEHIVDLRSGEPVRGRSAAWVALRVPERGGRGGPAPRAATLADALTTAFMVLPVEDVRIFCDRTAGLEAWLMDRAHDGDQPRLVHLGGAGR
jgi:thiamine biosynthesis lipoprotein